MNDPVKKPAGYQLTTGKELKDVLPDLLGVDGTVAAYKFNAIKYLTRFEQKNGHEDLMKAVQYIKMIDELLYPVNPSLRSLYKVADVAKEASKR